MRLQPYIKHTQPTGRYKIIDALVDKLYTLTYCDTALNEYNWFEDGSVFGLARIAQDEFKKRYPEILQRNNQYTPLVPDDSYKSMAFFYDNGRGDYIGGSRVAEWDFSVIVWYDRCKITNKQQEIIDIFAREVKEALYSVGAEPQSIYIEREQVYSAFDLEYFDKQYMHAPYNAFRIDFKALERCDAHSNNKFIR